MPPTEYPSRRHPSGGGLADGAPGDGRFERAPRLVFWETTKACPLACVHCRASAQPGPAEGELSSSQGFALIDELATADRPRPVLVLTGGDCLQRPDLVELAAHARSRRVPVAIAPSVSGRLSAERLAGLRSAGVSSASISLDGPNAAVHDAIRQVPGHFDATLAGIELLSDLGFHVQVNTAVMRANVEQLAEVAALLHVRGVRVWEVFFLVEVGRAGSVGESTTGRGAPGQIEAEEAEQVCHFLVDAARYGMVVRTVEAPFFRRVALGRARALRARPFSSGPLHERLSEGLARRLGEPTSPVLAPTAATRDGKGVIFVAHDGDVFPSGFLPLRLGNVTEQPLLEIYRQHPLLREIRAARFPGACGACEHADLCGGSRARAFAESGDPLGDDPSCALVAAARAQVSC